MVLTGYHTVLQNNLLLVPNYGSRQKQLLLGHTKDGKSETDF